MFIVKYRKIFFILTAVIIATAIFSVAFFGLNFGIDFTGGAITEVNYTQERPSKETLEERLQELSIGGFSIRPTGEDGYILRTKDLTEDERVSVLNALSQGGEKEVIQERYNSIGPTIGSELRNKAFVAIGIVIVAIILFVAFVFRKVSQPVSSWKYGIVAIIALIHDVIVPVGIFAFLSYTVGAEIDILFVMALLAILGYSVNDTIVVFDRVRENLRLNREHGSREDFELTVGKSLNQTYIRSINTSLTTLFVLLALFFFGSEATQNFALVLATGVIAGTYSSIFLATPLLVTIGKRASK
ncbi:MAG TPA: protein translocase subunit SecF [Candidatus Paceibacterota bacterium]|jgi:preprotein translocase subunit SecF|nr:protein translocase subunit SecF [Parcubacteria group bacterium]MDP6249402.1 protein translocase subunit SecF [Candidatus Paceibacterota bacterium]MDP7159118.1 protein translocase subunit SecF [Candidatus Paceibacterota bacterium]MDP7648447.1 protein translocase subunit SecF [Candidatus Paceibacterota bacterium]HJO89818.1 protein translocase subunit SecF [Candidatus Paceibacterota bacterium]|tara:strand:- start:242 stop:1144 length:903 start_codon:yes stop_codon:yes gene_type:complete